MAVSKELTSFLTVSLSMALDGYSRRHVVHRLSHTALAGALPHD